MLKNTTPIFILVFITAYAAYRYWCTPEELRTRGVAAACLLKDNGLRTPGSGKVVRLPGGRIWRAERNSLSFHQLVEKGLAHLHVQENRHILSIYKT